MADQHIWPHLDARYSWLLQMYGKNSEGSILSVELIIGAAIVYLTPNIFSTIY